MLYADFDELFEAAEVYIAIFIVLLMPYLNDAG